MVLKNVLVESCSDTHPSYIAEEPLNFNGFFMLNYRHEMQFEKLDH